MLKRSRRIPHIEFPALLSSRQFTHSAHFMLRYAAGSSAARAAVSVSKKVSKSAVTRNTIRRRTQNLLQHMLPKSGLYLFVAKTGAEKVCGEALRTEVAHLLKEVENRYNS